jgi:hypothetical protein
LQAVAGAVKSGVTHWAKTDEVTASKSSIVSLKAFIQITSIF